jgi:hypothetical protein
MKKPSFECAAPPSITRVRALIIRDPEMPEWLGGFSDVPEVGAIDLWARNGISTSTYRYYNPATPQCAEEDYESLQAYMRGDWQCVGVMAEARITVFVSGLVFTSVLRSGGVWGITDSDALEISTVLKEQMDDVRREVESAGIPWNADFETAALLNPTYEDRYPA